jgi:hypothetical protein
MRLIVDQEIRRFDPDQPRQDGYPVRFTTMTSALNPKGESKGLAAADSKGPGNL